MDDERATLQIYTNTMATTLYYYLTWIALHPGTQISIRHWNRQRWVRKKIIQFTMHIIQMCCWFFRCMFVYDCVSETKCMNIDCLQQFFLKHWLCGICKSIKTTQTNEKRKSAHMYTHCIQTLTAIGRPYMVQLWKERKTHYFIISRL